MLFLFHKICFGMFTPSGEMIPNWTWQLLDPSFAMSESPRELFFYAPNDQKKIVKRGVMPQGCWLVILTIGLPSLELLALSKQEEQKSVPKVGCFWRKVWFFGRFEGWAMLSLSEKAHSRMCGIYPQDARGKWRRIGSPDVEEIRKSWWCLLLVGWEVLGGSSQDL